MKKALLPLTFILLPAALAAVFVILDSDSQFVKYDDLPAEMPGVIVFEGDFPRYVTARERISDGAKSPLLVFDSKLMAQAAAENTPEGWQTIPVEQWQLERLRARTGRRHVGVVNGE